MCKRSLSCTHAVDTIKSVHQVQHVTQCVITFFTIISSLRQNNLHTRVFSQSSTLNLETKVVPLEIRVFGLKNNPNLDEVHPINFGGITTFLMFVLIIIIPLRSTILLWLKFLKVTADDDREISGSTSGHIFSQASK